MHSKKGWTDTAYEMWQILINESWLKYVVYDEKIKLM